MAISDEIFMTNSKFQKSQKIKSEMLALNKLSVDVLP